MVVMVVVMEWSTAVVVVLVVVVGAEYKTTGEDVTQYGMAGWLAGGDNTLTGLEPETHKENIRLDSRTQLTKPNSSQTRDKTMVPPFLTVFTHSNNIQT